MKKSSVTFASTHLPKSCSSATVHLRSPTFQIWSGDSLRGSPKEGVIREKRRRRMKKGIVHLKKIDRRLSI
jgi:hypothetical protein